MVATAVYGVLTVCVVALVAVAGLEAVRRLVPAERRREHNDVAGFIYAVVGVIYAVLLALTVIAVWEEHEAAKATVREEANELADVFWLARRLPAPEGPRLQAPARSCPPRPRDTRRSAERGHEAAEAAVRGEANELAGVFWLARRLPEPEGPRLQGLARSYATAVADEDWPLVARRGGRPADAR